MVIALGVGYFSLRALGGPNWGLWARAEKEIGYMRRFLMIAAAAAIALGGLTVAGCGETEEKAEKPAEEKPMEEKPMDEKPMDEAPMDEAPADDAAQ